MISRTAVQVEQKKPVGSIYLQEKNEAREEQEIKKKAPERPNIKWAQDVIDNQHMGKRRSNVCCIYHKRHGSDSSSSDTCTSDDQTNRMERQPADKKKHKLVCSKRCKHSRS